MPLWLSILMQKRQKRKLKRTGSTFFITYRILMMLVFFSDEETGEDYGFPLPVILIDGGVKVFSSSRFDHGKKVAEADGNYYVLSHGKIYKTDAQGTLNYEDEEHEHPTNVQPLDFSITKNVSDDYSLQVY